MWRQDSIPACASPSAISLITPLPCSGVTWPRWFDRGVELLKLLSVALAAAAGATVNVGEQPPRPRVAIIDSGVAKTPELDSLVVAEYDLAAMPARTNFQPRYDHAPMVPTILARPAGRRVEIVSLRIDDPAGCPAGASPPCQPSAAPVAQA